MPDPPQSIPGIIGVELADGQSFKFPVVNDLTPKSLLSNVAKKAGLSEYDHFGFVYNFNSEQPTSPTKNSNDTGVKEEKYFLVDEIPIASQITLTRTSKVVLALKYHYRDIKKEISDNKALGLIFKEYSLRFLQSTIDVGSKISTACLVAHLIRHKSLNDASAASESEVKEMCPKFAQTWISDPEFNELIKKSISSIISQSRDDIMRNYLTLLRQNFPAFFYSYFDGKDLGSDSLVELKINQDHIKIVFPELESSHSTYIVAIASISNWKVAAVENDKQAVEARAKLGSQSELRVSKAMNSLASMSLTSLDTPLSNKSILKNAFGLKKYNSGVVNDVDTLSRTSASRQQYKLTLIMSDQNIKALEICIFGRQGTDLRLIELLDQYEAFLPRVNLENDVNEVVMLDDPSKTSQIVTCKAKESYVAKSQNELMFLKGEEIVVLQKLSNGYYMGECQGVEGIFQGSFVTFKTVAAKELDRSRVLSNAKALEGETIMVQFVDETRKRFLFNKTTTPRKLIQQIAEKMEISDIDVFELILTNEAEDQCLDPNIPLCVQGVSSYSKLLFKLRLMYHDVSELSESPMVYFYFIQARHNILSGKIQINENQIQQFASFQLQGTLGDYDPAKFGSNNISSFIPIQHQKTVAKNEMVWQKKLVAAYHEHKGLTMIEAQKAYIALAQHIPFYAYQIYPSTMDLSFGISRDYIVLLNSATKAIDERYDIDIVFNSYTNNSFTFELILKTQNIEKQIRIISPKTPEMISLLNLVKQSSQKARLRKMCRNLREIFQLLGLKLETETENDKRKSDPELFHMILSNGVVLKKMIKDMEKPLPEVPLESEMFNSSGATSSDRDGKSIIQNIQVYQNYCTELGLSDDKILSATSLLNYSIDNVSELITCLITFFEVPSVKSRLSQLEEKTKALKLRNSDRNSAAAALTDADFRLKIVQELITTEKSYTIDMEAVVDTFLKPLREKLNRLTSAPFSPNSDMSSPEQDLINMFGNVDEIAIFNRDLTNELEQFCTDAEHMGEIGNVMLIKGDAMISLYESYCSNHSESSDRLQDFKFDSDVMAILKMNGDPQNDQIARRNLSSQLIKPVQRIMRYHLLLKELLKYTPPTHPGFPFLEKGYQKAKEVASAINEIKRQKEMERSLSSLLSRIEAYEGPPISTLGRLLLDGKLMLTEKAAFARMKSNVSTVKDSSYVFYLFDDCLIYCREIKKSSNRVSSITNFRFKGLIPIYCVAVSPAVVEGTNIDDVKLSFELSRSDTQKSYILSATSSEERDRWLSTLTDLLSKANSSLIDKELEWRKLVQKKPNEYDSSSISSKSKTFKLMRFGSKRAPIDDQESNTSLASFGSFGVNRKGVEQEDDKSVNILKSQLDYEVSIRESLQEQLTVLAKQLEHLRNETNRVTEDNKILKETLQRERLARQQLEVELAIERGKVQGFECIMNTTKAPTESPTEVNSHISPEAPKRPGIALTAGERNEVIQKLDEDTKARKELSNLIKSLAFMVNE